MTTTDIETSFTVEVLRFREGADPEALAGSVSAFFGISLEEGRRLVRKAPIRVKRGATPEITQRLVKQLRKLGAEVLVRNEQTGEERTYALKDAPPSQPAAPEPSPPEETLESDHGDPPPEDAPQVEVVQAPALYAEAAPEEPLSAPRDEPPASSAPGERTIPSLRDESRSAARDSAEPRLSLPGSSRRPSSGGSMPPPSSSGLAPPASPILSLPPPSTAKLDFCAACKGPVDKGETCGRCGWNNAEKERHCRQCKRKLSVVSAVSRKSAALGVAALGVLAIGAGVLVLLGPAAGAAGLALGACLAFVIDSSTLRYACKSCTIAVISGRLQKEEEGRLRTARTKALAAAALCGVMTAGLLAIASLAQRSLTDSSYGISWTLPVPRMNGRLGTELVTIRIPTGPKRVRMSFAERPYIGGPVYFLTHVQYTHPAAPSAPDPAGLEISIKQIVEVYFAGSLTDPPQPIGEGLQASFTGTFRGGQVSGYLRGIQNDHDMMIVAVVSGSKADVEDSSARDVLTAVVTTRDP